MQLVSYSHKPQLQDDAVYPITMQCTAMETFRKIIITHRYGLCHRTVLPVFNPDTVPPTGTRIVCSSCRRRLTYPPTMAASSVNS